VVARPGDREDREVTSPPAARTEPAALRALRLVALLEGLSFVLLLVCSVLKRTTELDLVPVLGPVHGTLYVGLVLLVLGQLRRLGWGPVFTFVMLTVGSPGAHFAVRATQARTA
jgi:integral membrane protein